MVMAVLGGAQQGEILMVNTSEEDFMMDSGAITSCGKSSLAAHVATSPPKWILKTATKTRIPLDGERNVQCKILDSKSNGFKVSESFSVGPTIGRNIISIPSRFQAGDDFVFSKKFGSYWIRGGEIVITGGEKAEMYLKDGLFHVKGEIHSMEKASSGSHDYEMGNAEKQARETSSSGSGAV